jgi:hypothetical protein
MSKTSKRLLFATAFAVTAITARVETPFAQNNESGATSASQQSPGAQTTANAGSASSEDQKAEADQKAQAGMTADRASVPQTEADRKAAAAMGKPQ